MFTAEQLRIARFCAEECERQQSGEFSVYRMMRAWNVAEDQPTIDETSILTIAFVLDSRNTDYRTVPVLFANGNRGAAVEDVPRLMTQLFTIGKEQMTAEPQSIGRGISIIPAEGWIKELLRIHPFVDGNGRLAAILWNKFNGTMTNPTPYPEQEWN